MCALSDGHRRPISGEHGWSLYSCTLTWDTAGVTQLDIELAPDAPAGWEFVLLLPAEADDPNVKGRPVIVLAEETGVDLQAGSVEFLIGARLGCTAPTHVDLPLEVTATSEHAIETSTESIRFSGDPPPPPEVSINSAAFTSVDIGNGESSSVGTISLDYRNAPSSCGWSLTTAITPFAHGDGSISVSTLSLISISNLSYGEVAQEGGMIIVSIPADVAPRDGTFTLTVSVHVPDETPEGTYTGSITVTPFGPSGEP